MKDINDDHLKDSVIDQPIMDDSEFANINISVEEESNFSGSGSTEGVASPAIAPDYVFESSKVPSTNYSRY